MFNQGPFQSAINVPPFFIHIALGIYKTKIGAANDNLYHTKFF
jgi:hypothetical protein